MNVEKVKDKAKVWLEIGSDMVFCILPLGMLHEQDMNPNTMSREMFNQLVENIKARGIPEEFPYCALTDKGVEIISGHHRVRSMREAGLKESPIILDVSGLSRDQVISKQLSHNTIKGTQDVQLASRLFAMITDVDQQIASYFSDTLGDINVDSDVLPFTPGLEFHVINLAFLPHQLRDFETVIQAIGENTESLMVAPISEWDKFKETVNKVRSLYNIKSLGTALSVMCDIVLESMDDGKT